MATSDFVRSESGVALVVFILRSTLCVDTTVPPWYHIWPDWPKVMFGKHCQRYVIIRFVDDRLWKGSSLQ